MTWWQKRNDILGVNARNLLYLYKYNSDPSKELADDKISSKNYLQSRGVGAARLYAVLRSHKELANFNPKILPESFVVKPNRGYGGEGITIIKATKGKIYSGTNNHKYTWSDLYQECAAILDGKYAISGLKDQVIFEELLLPDNYFLDFIEEGLPDIRIIVFNNIPIIAMLRLPTSESGGKANLHIGAVGLGIDLGTGKTTYGVVHGRFIKTLPNGKPVNSLVIPKWDEVLLTAVRVAQVSNLGFVGVDLTISKTGVKILEINARAGLNIQIANRVGLKTRLNKVADIKVNAPEEAVKVAKTLFSASKLLETTESKKPTIGLYESIEILNTKYDSVLAKIDPHAKRNIIDESLKDEITESLIEIKLANKRINIPIEFADLEKHNYKVILAGKFLSDFLIDTTVAIPQVKKTENKKIVDTTEEKILHNIDRKIYQIDRQLGIIPKFRPINLEEEKSIFLNNKSYSPKFIYKKISIDPEAIKKEIKKIPQQIDHPLMPLYQAKIKELNSKILLIEARGSNKIQHYSEKIYGRVTREFYQEAVSYVKNLSIRADNSEELNFKKIYKILSQYLKDHKLNHWKIKVEENLAADMAVSRRNTIFLRNEVSFSANRLQALIAHEIETHILRLENARLQKYKIFEVGMARYILAEEGLAIYNQKILNLALGNKMVWPSLNVIGIYLGRKMSFAELFNYLVTEYDIPDDEAWKVCVKVKRGLSNTEEKATFSRDFIYFAGEQIIKQFIKRNKKAALKQLYIGKIGIDDLPIIEKAGKFEVKWLPDYLKS